jgi:hypothetical protein
MRFGGFAFLVFLGGAIFLLSFIADRQRQLGDDRVERKVSRSVIDAGSVPKGSPSKGTNR